MLALIFLFYWSSSSECGVTSYKSLKPGSFGESAGEIDWALDAIFVEFGTFEKIGNAFEATPK